MKILINYANGHFVKSRELNIESARRVGGFDRIIGYGPHDLDEEFRRRNARILAAPRIGGYGLWKPYIMKKTLEEAKEGDMIFYCDSGAAFLRSPLPLFDLLARTDQDVIPFNVSRIERRYSKRDALILLGCDDPRYTDGLQRLSGYNLYRKSRQSMEFIDEFLKFAQDERIISDEPNRCGMPNYPDFVDHRHDQSIFSLLTKKWGFKALRNPAKRRWSSEDGSPYEQILRGTRASSLSYRLLRKAFSSRRYGRAIANRVLHHV